MLDDLYNFNLPNKLIAQQPARPRDSARLLVYDLKNGNIADSTFSEINNFLPKQTTLVVNNSKVENCRWLFDDGRVEIFVLEKLDVNVISALVRPGKKFKIGQPAWITPWLKVETLSIEHITGIRTLRLSVSHSDQRLKQFEHIPLPPYITQNDSLANEYQTIYAKPAGSLAAPTAGLHFTPRLLELLKSQHALAEVTLHVSLGTFAKLTKKNLQDNKLHRELYEISKKTADTLNQANHITAVGTTSIRTLESNRTKNSEFTAASDSTEIFIRPGYKFQAVDAVVTNFHLPGTSLLMLIAAFLADKKNLNEKQSAKELMRIYHHAIDNNYRFYSFGDAMLLV